MTAEGDGGGPIFLDQKPQSLFVVEIERENFPHIAYAAQAVMAEGFESGVLADCRAQFRGNQNLSTQGFAQDLDARGFVDRRSDNREVEAVDGADIAVEHLTQMKCQVGRGGRLAYRTPCAIQSIDFAHRLGRGVERQSTGLL